MIMKRLLSVTIILILTIFSSAAYSTDLTLNNVPTKVFFGPNGRCTDAIVNEINKAQSEILVQAYSVTSAPIAKALVDAHKRGVQVRAIMVKSQRTAKYSSATLPVNSKIQSFIDDQHNIHHNKIMIIDGTTVITGSFNFTKNAENGNAENLIIRKSGDLAKLYKDNWNQHKDHSEVYEARY